MNKITCCKDCEKRHKNCHSDCKTYLSEKADLERFKEYNADARRYHNQVMKTMYEPSFPKNKLKRAFFRT